MADKSDSEKTVEAQTEAPEAELSSTTEADAGSEAAPDSSTEAAPDLGSEAAPDSSTATAPEAAQPPTSEPVTAAVVEKEYPGSVSDTPTIEHPDGRVELRDESTIRSSKLYNPDLAPVPVAKRNWTTYNFAALWVSLSACIPAYMLSSGLMGSGMNWWQALLTILVGNLIVLMPILANSHPGTKYGIPFPVFARAAYGTIGSNLPALMRALVACGWFGIQCWIGGKAVFFLIDSVIPGWETMLGPRVGGYFPSVWASFLFFWALNVFVIYRGMEQVKKVGAFAAPFVLLMCFLLVVWAVSSAHGFGPLMSVPSRYNNLASFLPIFIPSLTAIIGFWATLSLNMPDFTRFGRSQREQLLGQAFALPAAMTVLSATGVIVTSAAVVIYPTKHIQQLWDPIALMGMFDNKFIVFIAMLTVAIATLAMNIAANVVSPANDFSNALPRLISFRTGGLITAFLGIALQPWALMTDPSLYIFKWLVGYSGGLGSIAGVLVVDYWIIKKKKLNLQDLYLNQGAYRYVGGWNFAAVAATLLGCAGAWGGLIIIEMRPLFDYGWFVGFFVAAVSYMLFMPTPKPEGHHGH